MICSAQMTIRLRVWTFVSALPFCIIGLSAETVAEESFENLILKLQSEDRAARTSAARELSEGGEETLRDLEAYNSADSNLEYQLRVISTKLRQRIARESLDGTQVTVGRPNEFTLQYAVESVSRQSHFEVHVAEEDRAKKLQFEQVKVPFWKSIDLIAQQADVGWEIENGDIVFDSNFRLRQGAVAYPKSMRIAAIHSRESRGFSSRAKRGIVRINFRVDIEPHITPYFVTVKDQDFLLKAKTKSGPVEFIPFNPSSVREIGAVGEPAIGFYVDFQNDEMARLDDFLLEGSLSVLSAAKTAEIVLPLRALQQNEAELRVLEFDKADEKFRVLVAVDLPQELTRFDSHRLGVLHQQVWLNSKTGTRLPPKSTRIAKIEGQTHKVEFVFNAVQGSFEEFQFVYRYPQFVTTLSVDFAIDSMAQQVSP